MIGALKVTPPLPLGVEQLRHHCWLGAPEGMEVVSFSGRDLWQVRLRLETAVGADQLDTWV
jgi:hypothetical protein